MAKPRMVTRKPPRPPQNPKPDSEPGPRRRHYGPEQWRRDLAERVGIRDASWGARPSRPSRDAGDARV